MGTPDHIVGELGKLSAMGLDGVLLLFVNFEDELRQWLDGVMPLVEQAGLRKPFFIR